MTLPNVIIAGARKCGTSSLFNWLSDHPEVCASTKKETRYFIDKGHPLFDSKANYNIHGMHKYPNFFKNCENDNPKIVVEVTPDYIYQKTALEIISTLITRPKILFILRKPSDRVFSEYNYALNNMVILDRNISFKEFVSVLKNDNGQIFHKRQILRNTIENSKYIKYMSEWGERAGMENIGVFLFEHLRDNPVDFMKSISTYIGINSTFWEHYSFPIKNKSVQIKNHILHKYIRKIVRLVPKVRQTPLKSIYARFNIEELTSKSEEDFNVLEELDKEFLPFTKELESTFNIDLSKWK